MILVFGTRTFHWGRQLTAYVRTCPNCGFFGHFEQVKRLRAITLFFVVPLIPISGIRTVERCPQCHTEFAQA